MMKKLILPVLFISGILSVSAQTDKAALLQDLETKQAGSQDITPTATIKSSTRLFKVKEDLTSVIVIIPAGSVVSVLDSDSTYLHVAFDENEGYIFRKHAVIDKTPNTFKDMPSSQAVKEVQPARELTDSRYNALESKYGSAMASRIYAGKIWKGMNSEMVKDSWGPAQKINRVISGNVIKEEWIFKNTWLYFENNMLLEWGPVIK
jgi:hypothetical protein